MFLALLLFSCHEEVPAPSKAPAAQAPASEAPAAQAPVVRTVDVATFKNAFFAGQVKTLIDVRTPGEFSAGHVPGAVNIPLDQVERRAEEIPREGEVFVICESGGRSARAAAILAETGRKTVNVEGGTYAWRNAGHPIE